MALRYSATYDVIQAGGTSHTYTGGSGGANEIDGDFNTAHSQTQSGSGSSDITSTVQGDHDLAKPVNIIEVKFRIRGISATDSYTSPQGGRVYLDVWLYYNGAYQNVYTLHYETQIGDIDTGTHTLTGEWLGVTAVRLKSDVRAFSQANTQADAFIYEVQATAVVNRSFALVV